MRGSIASLRFVASRRTKADLTDGVVVRKILDPLGLPTEPPILARAGVSKGSTLYYFATKEDLFLGALEWMVEQVHTRILETIATVDDPVEKMKAVIRTIFANAQESRQFFLAYTDFISIGTRNKRFHDLNAKFYEGCCGHDRDIIVAGIESGAFREVDIEDASSMVRALVDGLMLQWFFSSQGTFDDYRRRCERIVLEYLTGGNVHENSRTKA